MPYELVSQNIETLVLGDRERFIQFVQSERMGEQDLSNSSLPKSKSREFLWNGGWGAGVGGVPGN